jgi:AmiR/NasT family two-component response regulator
MRRHPGRRVCLLGGGALVAALSRELRLLGVEVLRPPAVPRLHSPPSDAGAIVVVSSGHARDAVRLLEEATAPVVVVGSVDEEAARRVLAAGAAGYLLDTVAPARLAQAIVELADFGHGA